MSDGDGFTEYSSESWFGRLKGALIGILIGLLFIPGSIWLLAWNEGRAVATARALAEGSGAVVVVGSDRVDPANQGHLVYVTGKLVVPGTLSDPDYGAAAPGAAKLVRQAEMYQWEQKETSETHNKLGGGTETATTYRYDRVWADHPIDSSKFKQSNGHANPPDRVRSLTKVAREGHIGAFTLDSTVLGKLDTREPMALSSAPPTGQLVDGGVYLGADPQNPALGDTRIHYFVVHPQSASVVAQQDGAGFRPYTTHNGQTLLMVDQGEVTAPAMFKEAQHENTLISWGLRALGVFLLFLGFFLLLLPLAVFASVLPILGDAVGFGGALIALLLTVIVAPLVIAIAWLVVRPLVGAAVLIGAAVVAVLLTRAVRTRRRLRTAPPPSPFFQGIPH